MNGVAFGAVDPAKRRLLQALMTPSIKSPQAAVDAAPMRSNIASPLIEGTMQNARLADHGSVPDYSPQSTLQLGGSKVVDAGKGWTELLGYDGEVIRREGPRNWRNNNPGNLEYGDTAKELGAIGTDGRFAVFPTYDIGRKAKENLLFENPNYRDRTIAGAITRYAPPSENNTKSYIAAVAKAAGVDGQTLLSALTPDQRVAMLDAMQKVEGFKPGIETRPYAATVKSAEYSAPVERPLASSVPPMDAGAGIVPANFQARQKLGALPRALGNTPTAPFGRLMQGLF